MKTDTEELRTQISRWQGRSWEPSPRQLLDMMSELLAIIERRDRENLK